MSHTIHILTHIILDQYIRGSISIIENTTNNFSSEHFLKAQNLELELFGDLMSWRVAHIA